MPRKWACRYMQMVQIGLLLKLAWPCLMSGVMLARMPAVSSCCCVSSSGGCNIAPYASIVLCELHEQSITVSTQRFLAVLLSATIPKSPNPHPLKSFQRVTPSLLHECIGRLRPVHPPKKGSCAPNTQQLLHTPLPQPLVAGSSPVNPPPLQGVSCTPSVPTCDTMPA